MLDVERVRKIEDFIRQLKPNVNFSEPKYKVGSSYFPVEDELTPETWTRIPRNGRSLILSRLGELTQQNTDRQGYVEEIETSVRQSIQFGFAESTRPRGIGNPMVAWSLAVDARIKCLDGSDEVGDYLFSLAQAVMDISKRGPKLKRLVNSQIQEIVRKT